MLKEGIMQGKGRALLAAVDVPANRALLVEAPLLCAARPGARHVCGSCLGDAREFCELCNEGTCAACGTHACTSPNRAERELRASIWYLLYERYVGLLLRGVEVDWDAFARVPTRVYAGWEKFASAAELFVGPVRRRWGERASGCSAASRALTGAGFLDFYLLARANAAAISDRGSAIFRTHACLNHSCDPNALVVRLLDYFPAPRGKQGADEAPEEADGGGTDGSRLHPASIIVLATRGIASGEEVCINYFTGEDARSELSSCYGAECLCPSCCAPPEAVKS